MTILRHVRPSVCPSEFRWSNKWNWYSSGLIASILVWHTCASALSGWVLYRQLELTELTHPDLHYVVGLFILKDVRLSVRPERFLGICPRTHRGNGLKFYMLMYLDHLQNWLVYGHSLFIFLILALFWLSEAGQIWGFRAFPGERMEEMAWNFACWCILTTVRTDLFMALFWLNGSNLGFPGISWRTDGGNGLKYGMLVYPDHLQNWLNYGYGLVIFLILMLFWLSEMGQIWGSQAFWSCSVDFPHNGDPLAEIGHIWGFWALSGEGVGVNVEGRAEAYFRRFASSSV